MGTGILENSNDRKPSGHAVKIQVARDSFIRSSAAMSLPEGKEFTGIAGIECVEPLVQERRGRGLRSKCCGNEK